MIANPQHCFSDSNHQQQQQQHATHNGNGNGNGNGNLLTKAALLSPPSLNNPSGTCMT